MFKLPKNLKQQGGAAPVLILIAVVGILIFFAVTNAFDFKNKLLSSLYPPKPASYAAANNSRISWQGNNWYIHGANVPWYNWGCDFGCNSTIGKSGGVSTNLTNLQAGFQQGKTAGMHVLRWWVFPGDPWQITRDSSGPIGIHPAVYTDFDAALKLAEQYDLYYDFVLFSAPTAMPTSWETDTTQRAKLAQVLGTLFAHYASNPRILSWETYNEPENDIWNGKIAQQPVVDTGTAITQSIHTNSPGTYSTIGSLFADGMKMWLNAGLDYYSPHWYDYMSSGDYCIICHNYDYYATWGINKPIVVGEYFTGTSGTTPYSSSYRYDYWYNNGYAGEWAWSLFPNQTGDKLAIDLTAAQIFASQHSDLGPSLTITPTPTPTSSNSPIPSASPLDTILPVVSITNPLNGATIVRNSKVTISANATDNIGVSKVEFYVDGGLKCTDTTPSYSCITKIGGKPGATHTITAKAYDAAGNVAISSITIKTL